MILREIAPQDAVIIRSWPTYPDEFKDLDYALRENGWISEYLGKKGTKVYVALDNDVLDNGVLIGFTILSIDDAEENSGCAEFRIAVNPNMLGQGAGEKLAKMTIEKGFGELGLGLQKIYLIVRKNNPRARRLYERCGFNKTGECRKVVNGIDVDFFKMELDTANWKNELKLEKMKCFGQKRQDNEKDE